MNREPEMDELDRILGPLSAPVGGQTAPAGLAQPATPPAAPTAAQAPATAIDKSSPYFDPCKKCGGSGRFRGNAGWVIGNCFACDGMGGVMRATTGEERAKAREATARRNKSLAELSFGAFTEQYPDEAAWIVANPDFEFARDLKAKIEKYGSATDGQLAAIHRCMQRSAERAEKRQQEDAERAVRDASAPTIETGKLEEAFAAATRSGLKYPAMRFEGLKISPAPAHGKNPGAIYVKTDDGTYLGKIVAGKFSSSRDCTAEQATTVLSAMSDPLATAVAYGKRTGRCSCCGRELTDPASVAVGIGPVCAKNFGF